MLVWCAFLLFVRRGTLRACRAAAHVCMGVLLCAVPCLAEDPPGASADSPAALDAAPAESLPVPPPPAEPQSPAPRDAEFQAAESQAADPLAGRAGPRLAPLPDGAAVWKHLELGLDIAKFRAFRPDGRNFEIVLLRIEPSKFDFVVLSASEEGERPSSLTQWADRHGLVAAINAGMYLPDGLTNTGYLKIGKHLNNPRIVGAFGAFFLAGPDSPDLPGAMLLDRTVDGWEAMLPRYSMVVQNYRFISATRRLLWQPGGPEHSVAAVGRDGEGRILFIHSREPVAGIDLGKLLLEMPVDIRLVMYVEGGSQAGLLLRTPELSQIWMGRHPADFWTSGNTNAPLPNVIGVRRKDRR